MAERTTEPLFSPLSDLGLLYPEPEDCSGSNSSVALGLSAVEPSKVISGKIRLTKANRSPSSTSNSPEVMNAVIPALSPVSLSSMPSS